MRSTFLKDAQNKNGWLYYDHCAKQRPAEKPAKICVSGFGADVDSKLKCGSADAEYAAIMIHLFQLIASTIILGNSDRWLASNSAKSQFLMCLSIIKNGLKPNPHLAKIATGLHRELS